MSQLALERTIPSSSKCGGHSRQPVKNRTCKGKIIKTAQKSQTQLQTLIYSLQVTCICSQRWLGLQNPDLKVISILIVPVIIPWPRDSKHSKRVLFVVYLRTHNETQNTTERRYTNKQTNRDPVLSNRFGFPKPSLCYSVCFQYHANHHIALLSAWMWLLNQLRGNGCSKMFHVGGCWIHHPLSNTHRQWENTLRVVWIMMYINNHTNTSTLCRSIKLYVSVF